MNIFSINKLLYSFYNQLAPKLEEILAKEPDAVELLETDKIMAAVKASGKEMVEYLQTKRPIMEQLLDMVLAIEGDLSVQYVQRELTDHQDPQFKHPMLAAELLAFDFPQFAALFFEDTVIPQEEEEESLQEQIEEEGEEEKAQEWQNKKQRATPEDGLKGVQLLGHLLSFLKRERHNEMMCVYFSNIMTNLLEHRGGDLLEYMLAQEEYSRGLLNKIEDYTISQLVLKLVLFKAKDGQEDTMLKGRLGLVDSLVELLLAPSEAQVDTDHRQRIICNVTQVLSEVARSGQTLLLQHLKESGVAGKVLVQVEKQGERWLSHYGLQVVLAMAKADQDIQEEVVAHWSVVEELLRVEQDKRGWNTVYQAWQIVQAVQERAPLSGSTVESLRKGLVENRWNSMLHILLEDILLRMVAEQKEVLVENNIAEFIRTVLSTCTSKSHGCVGVVVRVANQVDKEDTLTAMDEHWAEFKATVLDTINRRQNQVLGEGPAKDKDNKEEKEQENESQWNSSQFWRREVSVEEDELEALMKDL